MIPKPSYTVINTSRGEDPAVVVVNSSLRSFKDFETLPWHLKLTVSCKFLGINGMPTNEEIKVLEEFEDELSASLQAEQNAVLLARITCRGERELLYRVLDAEAAHEALQQHVSVAEQSREWEYRMEYDPDWAFAQPELKLLEQNPRFN